MAGGRCWSSPDTRFGGEPVGLTEKSSKMNSVSALMGRKHLLVQSLESWTAVLKYARTFETFLAHGLVFYSEQNCRAKTLIRRAGIEHLQIPDREHNFLSLGGVYGPARVGRGISGSKSSAPDMLLEIKSNSEQVHVLNSLFTYGLAGSS